MNLDTAENPQQEDDTFLGVVKDAVFGSFRKRVRTLSFGVSMRPPFTWNRRQSEPAVLERSRTIRTRTASFRTLNSTRSGSTTSSVTNSKLFLMGDIVTSPNVPIRRKTSIPLSMHAGDYMSMLQQRQRQWSISRQHSIASQNAVGSLSEFDHICPYINGAEICRKCTVSRKRQLFLKKLGKLFVFYEYQSEENKIKVVVSQYGNVHIEGQKINKKPNVRIYVKVTFETGETNIMMKRLDWCRRNDEFKFNYLNHFDCETEDIAKRAHLEVKVMYKKSFFTKRKVLQTFTTHLNTIEVDPEDPEELRLY